MNTRDGVEIEVWGMNRTSDTKIGKLVWDVEKGTVNGFLIYNYSIQGPDAASLDMGRQMLLLGSDADVGTDDMFIIDGKKYYSDGAITSWKIYAGSRFDHYEIPLKAHP